MTASPPCPYVRSALNMAALNLDFQMAAIPLILAGLIKRMGDNPTRCKQLLINKVHELQVQKQAFLKDACLLQLCKKDSSCLFLANQILADRTKKQEVLFKQWIVLTDYIALTKAIVVFKKVSNCHVLLMQRLQTVQVEKQRYLMDRCLGQLLLQVSPDLLLRLGIGFSVILTNRLARLRLTNYVNVIRLKQKEVTLRRQMALLDFIKLTTTFKVVHLLNHLRWNHGN